MSSEIDRLNQTSPPNSSRYEVLEKVAAGGMATVYVGKLRGAEGFWRLVAIKRPHQHLLEDSSFRRMFVEEARLASKIHHPNVVPVLDVEERTGGQLLLVMDYIEGASLAELMDACNQRGGTIPPRISVRIALDALAGLHAAHELTDTAGRQLRLVHRDVSPHNVLVGIDGTSRVADFGIAKSVVSKGVTESGVLKGKLAYMAPEYIQRQECDARSDVFSMAIVAWEATAGRRLFKGESDYDTLRKIVQEPAAPLSSVAPWVGSALDAVITAALDPDRNHRTPTARAFAEALESAARKHDLVATSGEVGDFLREVVADRLSQRRDRLRRFLDAGGTTGPMDAAIAAVAQATPIRMEPSLPVAPIEATAPTVATPVPAARLGEPEITSMIPPRADTPPPSQAVTSLGAEGTERALVAAGILPGKRNGSTLFIATGAVVVVAAITGVVLLRGDLRATGSAPAVSATPATSAAATAGPHIAPFESASAPPPSATPSSSTSSQAAPPPSSTSPIAPTRKVGGSPSPPAPPPAAPPAPQPPETSGPIRKNPYR
jgi:hypothetical protein